MLRTILLLTLLGIAGCASTSQSGGRGDGEHRPTHFSALGRAAVSAAADPRTWVPVVGAAVLIATGADVPASDWLARETPLFGTSAADYSDLLVDVGTAAWLLTALAARRESAAGAARGLGVGAGALILNRGLTGGLKSVVSRERPNGRDDRSFPSGHTSAVSVSTTLAIANLDYLPVSAPVSRALRVGLYGVAGATALARVEAGEHHIADVLAGYGLGHFVAAMMRQAFQGVAESQADLRFVPAEGGGMFILGIAL